MKYYILEPEVAGNFGEKTVMNPKVHPPHVETLHYQFDGWLGDVLLATFPCFIATGGAVDKLKSIAASGVQFEEVYISKSEQFDELYPNRNLPEFYWLKITGNAGVQDFGMNGDLDLVVSQRVLDALEPLGLSNAIICPAKPQSS